MYAVDRQAVNLWHLFAYASGAIGATSSFVIAASGDHITAVVVAAVASIPGVLTWRETRKNRAEIRKRRTVVTRGDTEVTITDEDIDELER